MQASSSSSIVDCDMDKDLDELVEFFGSEFSLEDISSAYFQSRQDKHLAAEILCCLDGSTCTNFTADMVAAENVASMKSTCVLDNVRAVSLELPSMENAFDGGKRTKELKSKKCSASMGSVSCVIGKEYATKTGPFKNEVVKVKKPLILDSKEFPISELWDEKNQLSTATRKDTEQADVEEFLFKMLGEGFQLDMPVIQEVLGLCGYDMQKSVDKLLNLSVAPFSKSENHGMVVEDECHLSCSTGKCSKQECIPLRAQKQLLDSAQSDAAGLLERNLACSPEKGKYKIGIQKELLQALFDVPDRSEEAPKRIELVRAVKKPKAFRRPVSEAPNDATLEAKSSVAESPACTYKEDDDNSYEVLRTAVKEHRFTMKEYYKAAADAFVKGDHARANKLLEKGQFFNNKAREAEDKSCQKLLETRDAEVMSLNMHGLEPKEALSLLKLHLTTICGISSIKYLRVLIESNNEDTRTGARKRRLILKQLEKESIKWNDEDNGKAILIQIDAIDPKRLSFGKKKEPGDQDKRGPKPESLGILF